MNQSEHSDRETNPSEASESSHWNQLADTLGIDASRLASEPPRPASNVELSPRRMTRSRDESKGSGWSELASQFGLAIPEPSAPTPDAIETTAAKEAMTAQSTAIESPSAAKSTVTATRTREADKPPARQSETRATRSGSAKSEPRELEQKDSGHTAAEQKRAEQKRAEQKRAEQKGAEQKGAEQKGAVERDRDLGRPSDLRPRDTASQAASAIEVGETVDEILSRPSAFAPLPTQPSATAKPPAASGREPTVVTPPPPTASAASSREAAAPRTRGSSTPAAPPAAPPAATPAAPPAATPTSPTAATPAARGPSEPAEAGASDESPAKTSFWNNPFGFFSDAVKKKSDEVDAATPPRPALREERRPDRPPAPPRPSSFSDPAFGQPRRAESAFDNPGILDAPPHAIEPSSDDSESSDVGDREGEDTTRPRRGRRRRGRGGRGRSRDRASAETNAVPAEDIESDELEEMDDEERLLESSAALFDLRDEAEAKANDELDAEEIATLGEPDDRTSRRAAVPSWKETVGVIVDHNLSRRSGGGGSQSPSASGSGSDSSRRRRARGGRRRPPRTGGSEV